MEPYFDRIENVGVTDVAAFVEVICVVYRINVGKVIGDVRSFSEGLCQV